MLKGPFEAVKSPFEAKFCILNGPIEGQNVPLEVKKSFQSQKGPLWVEKCPFVVKFSIWVKKGKVELKGPLCLKGLAGLKLGQKTCPLSSIWGHGHPCICLCLEWELLMIGENFGKWTLLLEKWNQALLHTCKILQKSGDVLLKSHFHLFQCLNSFDILQS